MSEKNEVKNMKMNIKIMLFSYITILYQFSFNFINRLFCVAANELMFLIFEGRALIIIKNFKIYKMLARSFTCYVVISWAGRA